MGRRPTIDRDQVLDLAARIVAERGAAALTVDAVASAAGISKGGVQSCFGAKEGLIRALLERWFKEYADGVASALGGNASGLHARIRAHVDLSLDDIGESPARAATLVAALLQSPEQLGSIKAWYAERLSSLFAAGDAGRALRMAFLATEGAVLLRHFGLATLSPDEWTTIRADVDDLLTAAAGETGGRTDQ